MKPHHVDIHVGRKVRQCRWLVGMSMEELAERIGVSYARTKISESKGERWFWTEAEARAAGWPGKK